MAWLPKSLANSLKLETEEEEEEPEPERNQQQQPEESGIPGRGVKEDLSQLTKTFTRQLWGVASFLAPPPEPPSSSSSSNPQLEPSISSQSPDSSPLKDENPPRLTGIRNDFAEIGGRFRTGISKLSSHKAVSEISKLASSFLPFGSEEEIDDDRSMRSVGNAVGVTDEVLTFAKNISMHPETWLDFPLFLDDEDADDFDMSDAQQEHALAVERLAPRLAALRIELCPGHMSEGCFWKIYFVLLHSRLNKHDAELLSTPQIVEARGMLMQLQESQNRRKSDERGPSYTKEAFNSVPQEQFASSSEVLSNTTSIKTCALEPVNSIAVADVETEKYPVVTSEIKMVDKSVVSSKEVDPRYEEDGDDWLEEENVEMGPAGSATIPLGNEEDVSFSDLEEDDDSKPVSDSSTKSRGWVQLSKSSDDVAGDVHPAASKQLRGSSDSKESNDWLNVDDIDVV